LKWVLACLVVGCALRFYFAWDAEELRDDEKFRYIEIADHLRQGDGFLIAGNPTAQAMPLWPCALALWPLKPHYLNAILSSLTLVLAWLLARRLAGAKTALVVLALMAVDLDQASLGGSALTEPLFTVLLLSFGLSWALGKTLPAAGLLGLATLTRPEAFLVPLAMALFGREWKRPLVLLAGVVVAVAPWAIRNAAMFDAFVPFTTTGGITLHAGMNEMEMDLAFRRRGQGRGAHYKHALVMARERTEVSDDRELSRQAVAYAREHPRDALSITAAKAMLLWTPVQRKGKSAVYALAILFAWWGLIRRRRFTPPLVGPMLLVMTFVGLMFLAIPRYRAPYDVFVFLLAAGAIVREATPRRT